MHEYIVNNTEYVTAVLRQYNRVQFCVPVHKKRHYGTGKSSETDNKINKGNGGFLVMAEG